MANRIQLRRDTAANWEEADPILAAGEVGVDLTNKKIKIGDGTTAWTALDYWDDQEPNGFDGSYNSLTGKPTLFSGSYNDLTNKPTLFSGSYNDLSNKPDFATVATSGSYADLSNKPTIPNLSSVAQDVLPDADNARDLGSPDKQWRHVYTAGGSIYLDNIKLTNVGGKFTATKVVNPGEENEAPDPEDSDATSEISGGGNQLVQPGTGNTFALMEEGDVVFDGEGPGGVNRGLVWQYGDNQNGINSQIRQDNMGLTVRAWTENNIEGNYSAPVNIVTNQDASQKTWTFDGSGALTFPDGSIQTTAYTGSTISKFVMVNQDGGVYGSDDGTTWTGPFNTGLTSLGRVAVGPNTIVYIGSSGQPGNSLYYTTAWNVTPTQVTDPEISNWNQVRYFASINKFVAVGNIDNIPTYKHSSDGITWTTVSLDNTWGATLDGGAGYGGGSFTDIATNGTGGFLLTTGNTILGSFYTTALTTNSTIGSSEWLNDGMSFYRVLYSTGMFSGWFAFGNGNTGAGDGWWLNSSANPADGSFSNGWGISDISQTFRDYTGYEVGWSEITVGRPPNAIIDSILIATEDGQVLYWPTEPAGPYLSIPKPYTSAITNITSTNPATLSWQDLAINYSTGEKIVITNCGNFNGTYYMGANNELFTNIERTISFDATALTYTSGGTVTFTHGQYIDALNYAGGKFYAGNDDEEIFVSEDGGATWTEVAALNPSGGENGPGTGTGYMNDVDGYVGEALNYQLVNGSHSFTLNNDGTITAPTLTVNLHNGGNQEGQVLQFGEADKQAIITGPTPTGNNSAQRLIIQGQRGSGSGEGGDVYLWAGDADTNGGDIKIYAGDADNVSSGSGGYVNIDGGSGYNGGGDVTISGGYSANGTGGNVNIRSGQASGSGVGGAVVISTINNAGTSKDWSFDYNGVLTLPEGGDIRNSTGSSVLEAQPSNPQTLNTVKGWFQLQGNRPNDGDEVAFQTITTFGNYIYTAGLNYYAPNQWEDDSPVVQKINKNTGEVVWSKRIVAGHDAQFNFEIVSGVVNVVGLPNAGTGYKAGEQLLIPGWAIGGSQPQGNVYVQVDTVDGTGAITGYVVSQQPQTPGSDGTYNNVPVYNNNNNVQPYSIAYDLNGEQLVLACRTYRGAWSQENQWGYAYIDIYCLDDLTGAVNQSYTLKDANDMEPTSVAVSSTGQIAVAGQKYNEYRSFGTLNILAPGNGYFDILKSNLDPEHYPDSGIPGDERYNFYIQGTGIAYQEGVDQVNYYQNVPTTVREGSGTVTVDVVCDGTGPYTYGAVTVQAGGTNYVVGHKIKYLGTQIPGGATPANDLILTVTGVDGSGTITTATASGTAPSGGTITGLTAGTNYQVGSGAQLNINISPVTGLITSIGTGNFGDYHYVIGDVLTVAGTNFANGFSPANDITVTVTDVFLGGPNGYSAPTGTVPSDALRIQVDGINFNTPGSWTMRQTLGGEAFIWTPTWNKAIGSSNNDYFNSVTFSPDGNSIYAVGSGQYEVTYQQALVVKFEASTGNIAWSKYVNSRLTPGSEIAAEAMNVLTLTNGNVIVAIGNQYQPDPYRNEHGLVCLGSDGSLQWAKTYQEPNNGFTNQCQVSRDSDNNLYLVYVSSSADGSDAWTILKINSTNGNRIWSRALGNNNSMYFEYNWNKDYAVVNGTDIFIAGYTYIPNDNYYSALLVKFPTDGFKTFDATGWFNGQQFGDLRIFEPVVEDVTQTQVPPTFTPTVHSNAITTATNEKAFAAITDQYQPRTYLQYFTRDDLGFVQFGDGSKQSFATNIEPQVLGSNNQRLKLGPNDSGKHFFFDTNCGWGRIVIPSYDEDDSIPVGFKITIVNCSGSNVYVEALQPVNNNYYSAEIWGAGRNIRTREWAIPDSGSGSMVTLMKVKDAQYTGGENYGSPRWIISGPDDIYDSW